MQYDLAIGAASIQPTVSRVSGGGGGGGGGIPAKEAEKHRKAVEEAAKQRRAVEEAEKQRRAISDFLQFAESGNFVGIKQILSSGISVDVVDDVRPEL